MTMIEDAPAGAAGAEPGVARAAVEEMIQAGLLDRVMSRAESGELALTGEGGFLPEMVRAVLERGLAAELTGHLGYEKGDPAGRGTANSRNGPPSWTGNARPTRSFEVASTRCLRLTTGRTTSSIDRSSNTSATRPRPPTSP